MFGGNPLLLLVAMMGVVFLSGTVLDFIPIVLIFTPVFMHIVLEAGIDPVYFGVIFIIINCSLGMVTPPVGGAERGQLGRQGHDGAVHARCVALSAGRAAGAGGPGAVSGAGDGAGRLVEIAPAWSDSPV